MKTRKTYDPDFKEKAVSLCALRGSIKEVAEELGLRPDLLRRWKREFDQYQKNSFPGRGKAIMTDEQREIANLRTHPTHSRARR